MGQIVGGAAKPKRCNLQSLSSLGTPAAGEYILVSSDNSMNAAGQGNFDCYIVGDGTTAATALELRFIEKEKFNKDISADCTYTTNIAAVGSVGSAYTTTARPSNQGMTYIPNTGSKINITGYFYSISRHVEYIDANNIILGTKQFTQNATGSYDLEFPSGAVAALINSQGSLTILETQYLLDYTQNGFADIAQKFTDSDAQIFNLKEDITFTTPTNRGRLTGAVGSAINVDANTGYRHFFLPNDGSVYQVVITPPNNSRYCCYVDSNNVVLAFPSNITDGAEHTITFDFKDYPNAAGVYVVALTLTALDGDSVYDDWVNYKIYKLLDNAPYSEDVGDGISLLKNHHNSPWIGRTLAFYGDSITEICQDNHYAPDAKTYGDYAPPFEFYNTASKYNWAARVGKSVGASAVKVRGIGGQGWQWDVGGSDGGCIGFVYADSGRFIGRMNGDYSTWDGSDLSNYTQTWTGNSKEIISAGLSNGTILPVRGAGCSWLRITRMFPAAIKDSIDVVCIAFHNDASNYDADAPAFIANDATDVEWAASGSDYYGKIGGDYNINTLKGGIASTIMKMQMWMPNAVIVIMTPISGTGTTGQISTNLAGNQSMQNLTESVRDMHKLLSIPMIDLFATDGINGWNRTKYISDNIHPRTAAGSQMIARAVICGLSNILPTDAVNWDEVNAL